jgi:GGDEF domain-containing protein
MAVGADQNLTAPDMAVGSKARSIQGQGDHLTINMVFPHTGDGMGVVVLADANANKMAFAEFYSRADALMYEAKASGRNRLCYERLTVFRSAPEGRKAEEEQAA